MKKSRYSVLNLIVLSVLAILLISSGMLFFFDAVLDNYEERKLLTFAFSILITWTGLIQAFDILRIKFKIKILCMMYFSSAIISFFSAVKIGTLYWGGGLFVMIIFFVVIGICCMGAGIFITDKNFS